MSKLAALAKARKEKQAQQVSGSETSVSLLDKLKTNKPSRQLPTRKPLSKLAGLRKLKQDSPALAEDIEPKKDDKEIKEEESTQPKRKLEPIITLQEVTFPSCPFIHSPQTLFSQTFTYKKRHIDSDPQLCVPFMMTNNNALAAIKQNFSKPSPDDAIKAKQNSAFEKKEENLTEKVAELKINTPKVSKPRQQLDIDLELSKRSSRPTMSFVVIGHVDAGKSTLTGRLLLESKTVSQSTYNKLKREAEKAGKSSFSLAWVMDQTPEERNRGVTIDICSSSFETEKGIFTIVDAPGHRDFVPNMITGVAQADLAVLVVDSGTDAFESGFNLDGQTKEHTILARSLGINKMLVCVNKMDQVGWNEHRFHEIETMMNEFLKMGGWDPKNVVYVPCSGLSGINVSKKATEQALDWYKGGPSVIEALESFETADRDYKKPFVMQIHDLDASNSEFSGRIDTGIIQPGETVGFSPSGAYGYVDSITIRDTKTPIGIAGDSVSIKVKDAETENIRVGDVMRIITEDVPAVTKFKARIVTFDMDRPLLVGTPFVLFRGNIQQQAKIAKIITVFDKATGEPLKRKAKHLIARQSAIVEIETERKLPLQLYKENKQMGRIVLRKEGRTVGAGVVESL
jgi:elongation factor 1 alpha-like protein